jgi:hypothetical protein
LFSREKRNSSIGAHKSKNLVIAFRLWHGVISRNEMIVTSSSCKGWCQGLEEVVLMSLKSLVFFNMSSHLKGIVNTIGEEAKFVLVNM